MLLLNWQIVAHKQGQTETVEVRLFLDHSVYRARWAAGPPIFRNDDPFERIM